MTALAVVVYRPFVGRHWAGTRPAPTMVALDSDSGRWSHPFLLSTLVGVTKGAMRGSPPAQGRAEGPTAELQWSVVGGQWSEAAALALLGVENCR